MPSGQDGRVPVGGAAAIIVPPESAAAEVVATKEIAGGESQPAGARTSTMRPSPRFACPHCSSRFHRQEHLTRHAAAHGHGKLYSCEACKKDFTRQDVLTRHYRTCRLAKAGNFQLTRKAKKVNRACRLCNELKIRCTGGPKCDKCADLGMECVFTPRNQKKKTLAPIQSGPGSVSAEPPATEWPARQQCSPLDAVATPAHSSHGEIDTALLDAVYNAVSYNALNSWTLDLPAGSANDPNSDFTGAPAEPQPASSLPESGDIALQSHTESDVDACFQLDPFDFAMMYSAFGGAMDTDNDEFAFANDFSSPFLSSHQPGPLENRESSASLGGYVDPASGLPEGLGVAQLDPWEGHSISIISYLRSIGLDTENNRETLKKEQLVVFIRSYFVHFHQHTPLLHLPLWNIGTVSTSLVFAMSLIGAMYSNRPAKHNLAAQELYTPALSFAWSIDKNHVSQDDGKHELERIQALYLLVLLNSCYCPNKKRTRTDWLPVIDAARTMKLFEEVADPAASKLMSWQQWAAQESRRRTAFIIYLLDCMRVVFFGERPNVAPYELRLRLSCHEDVFAAPNAARWESLMAQSTEVGSFQFPIVISSLLSPMTTNIMATYSVMGSFIILHGILVFIWERQQFDNKSRPTGDAELMVIEQLARENNNTALRALQTWRENWNQTMLSPSSQTSGGLYRDRAMAYWFLGQLMNSGDRNLVRLNTGGKPDRWSMRIPKLLTNLIVKLDGGQLVDIANINDLRARCLDGEAQDEPEDGGDEMSTFNVQFIMTRKSKLSAACPGSVGSLNL